MQDVEPLDFFKTKTQALKDQAHGMSTSHIITCFSFLRARVLCCLLICTCLYLTACRCAAQTEMHLVFAMLS